MSDLIVTMILLVAWFVGVFAILALFWICATLHEISVSLKDIARAVKESK